MPAHHTPGIELHRTQHCRSNKQRCKLHYPSSLLLKR